MNSLRDPCACRGSYRGSCEMIEAVWMSLKYAFWLFFSTSPDDPAPYVFIRLQDSDFTGLCKPAAEWVTLRRTRFCAKPICATRAWSWLAGAGVFMQTRLRARPSKTSTRQHEDDGKKSSVLSSIEWNRIWKGFRCRKTKIEMLTGSIRFDRRVAEQTQTMVHSRQKGGCTC